MGKSLALTWSIRRFNAHFKNLCRSYKIKNIAFLALHVNNIPFQKNNAIYCIVQHLAHHSN
jgi:hypothetical protein